MKSDNTQKEAGTRVQPVNTTLVMGKQMNAHVRQAIYGLALIVANIIDSAAEGNNSWLTIGITRDKTGVLLTMHTPDTQYAGGKDLVSVIEDAVAKYFTADELTWLTARGQEK